MKRRKHRRRARENPLGGVLLPALGAVAGIGTVAYAQYAERKAEASTDETAQKDKDQAVIISRVGGGIGAVSGVLLGLQGHIILGSLLGLAGVGTLIRPMWPLEGYRYALGQGDQAPPADGGGGTAPPPAGGGGSTGPKPSGGLTPLDALNPLEFGYQIGQRIFGKG